MTWKLGRRDLQDVEQLASRLMAAAAAPQPSPGKQVWRQLSPDPDANYYVVRNYIEGTLVIDVFERETKTTLWRGVGQIDFQREKDARRRAPQVVAAILAEFPPDRDEASGS